MRLVHISDLRPTDSLGDLEPGQSCPAPLGFEMAKPVFVPEGQARIAQRFNVGDSDSDCISPEGTAEVISRATLGGTDSAVPSGLGSLCCCPNVETLGYCQPSPGMRSPKSSRYWTGLSALR